MPLPFLSHGKILLRGAEIVGTYAMAIAGVDAGTRFLRHVTQAAAPQYEPVVAGFGDTMLDILDPADLSGRRKAKEDKLKAEAASAQADAKKQAEAKKAADKKLKEARSKAAKAEALARKNEEKAQKLQAEADAAKTANEKALKEAEARRVSELAQAQDRWAKTTNAMITAAQNNPQAAKSLDLAQKALVLAEQAVNPATSAIKNLSDQSTDAGRALAAEAYDAINREAEPDYDALVQRMAEGDSSAFVELQNQADWGELNGLVAGVDPAAAADAEACAGCGVAIAGSCCQGCALSSLRAKLLGVPQTTPCGDVVMPDVSAAGEVEEDEEVGSPDLDLAAFEGAEDEVAGLEFLDGDDTRDLYDPVRRAMSYNEWDADADEILDDLGPMIYADAGTVGGPDATFSATEPPAPAPAPSVEDPLF